MPQPRKGLIIDGHTHLERLLLETDAPVGYQDEKSEPRDVFRTLEAVAEIKGADREEVAEVTTLAFFELARAVQPAGDVLPRKP